jgi:hypothetical protein
MSIQFTGFCGPSYTLENRYATIERCVNWYPVVNESADETKSRTFLSPSPGNSAFGTLPVPAPFNQPNRAMLENRGMAFGVNGTTVFSIDSTGVYTSIGTVVNDGNPASMVANGAGQIFIASGGMGYVIPNGGGAGSLVAVGSGFLGASMATFQDDYVIVVTPGSNQFQISGNDSAPLGDATLWDASNIMQLTGQADLLRAAISSREYIRFLGARRSQVYYNAGSLGIGGFPFQSYNETIIETGIAAPFSLCDFGQSLIWIGEDARGLRACWRDAAFQPIRVSTFAIEQEWQSYYRIDDAVAFVYVWEGHLFYQVTFPHAILENPGETIPRYTSKTWVYDGTAGVRPQAGIELWHERQFLNGVNQLVGRSELFHCYCYGKHLVGSGGADGNPGAVYAYSESAFTDCALVAGAQVQRPIVRDRIAPHLWQGNKRVIYNRIELEVARGVGLDGGVFGSNPVYTLRWSNDAGNTFGSEYDMAAGKIGEYGRRVYLNRCGYARDRVFWLRSADPVYAGVVGAELDITLCGS